MVRKKKQKERSVKPLPTLLLYTTVRQFRNVGLCLILLLGAIAFWSAATPTPKKNTVEDHINALYNESRKLVIQHPKQAKQKVYEGLKLARQENNYDLIVRGKIAEVQLDQMTGYPTVGLRKAMNILINQPPRVLEDKIRLTKQIGDFLEELEMDDLAINYKIKLAELLKTTPDFKLYGTYENIALLYLDLDQPDKAYRYFMLAKQLGTQLEAPYFKQRSHYCLGLYYRAVDNNEMSYYHYNEVLKTLRGHRNNWTFEDSTMYGLALGNEAKYFEIKGDFKTAQQVTKESIPYLEIADVYDLLIAYLNARLYADELGQHNEAKLYLDLSRSHIASYKDSIIYFEDAIDHYKRLGQIGTALSYSDSLNKLYSFHQTNVEKLPAVKRLIAFHNSRLTNELSLQRKLRERDREVYLQWIQLIIFGTLSGLIAFAFIIYRRNRLKSEQLHLVEKELFEHKIQLQELEKVQLTTEIEHKTKSLQDFAADFSRKKEFGEELHKMLVDLRHISDQDTLNRKVSEAVHYMKSHLSIDDSFAEFQESINALNAQFSEKLSARCPDLSSSEIKICALLKLELSSKEIATIRNISVDSVKTMRHRIRKKLALDTEDKLHIFLRDL